MVRQKEVDVTPKVGGSLAGQPASRLASQLAGQIGRPAGYLQSVRTPLNFLLVAVAT